MRSGPVASPIRECPRLVRYSTAIRAAARSSVVNPGALIVGAFPLIVTRGTPRSRSLW